MTVEIPDHFGGKPIPEDAIEIALAKAEKKKKDGNEGEAPPLDGFIYVPSVNLYVAKEKSHLGKNWENAHRELDKQNLRMPTIPQFIEFLKYLKAVPTPENTKIYNKITKKRAPLRAEHLDAKFIEEDGALKIQYHIFDDNGRLVPHKEDLECSVMENRFVSLDFNNQGFPKSLSAHQNYVQGENIFFGHPRDGAVARFVAGSISAGLYCYCNSTGSDSGSKIGVRAVRTRAQNEGGKQ